MRDYEVLRKELPGDSEVAESLQRAQIALKKSCGEEVPSVDFGGEVEEVSSLNKFKAAISYPGELSSFVKCLVVLIFCSFSTLQLISTVLSE